MAYDIISRKDARAQGLTKFYTGVPCKYGHIAERQVASGSCSVCANSLLRKRYKDDPERGKTRTKEWRARNIEKAKASEVRYRAENPEKRKATVNRWRKENPEKVKEINRRGRVAYYLKSPDAVAESKRKWAEEPANKIARMATIKAWREANPEKANVITRNRRARIKGSSGSHTAEEVAAILVAQNYCCAYCCADLRVVRKHLDHIVPISKGGSNDKSNLQWLCSKHNVQKNARDPIEYERSIGFSRHE